MRLLAFILFCFFVSGLFAQAEISMDELRKAYREMYLASAVDSIAWKSKPGCDPGTIPEELYQKAELRINFFRRMNRLPDIKITGTNQMKAQRAALMMERNNRLSHTPSPSWKCYSKEGAEGAKNSCLGLVNFRHLKHTAFLTGFIADPGDANYFVGHRRWLLYSRATEFSLGATTNAVALYSTHNISSDTLKTAFIAYPWPGWVPAGLIFSKWSFAIPEGNRVDFSKASVKVQRKSGESLPLQLFSVQKGAPDHCITWKMTSLFNAEDELYSANSLKEQGLVGETLKVTVSDVQVNGVLRKYEYFIRISELR